MATATNDKPVRLGDLPVVKTNILENARQYDKGVVGGYSGTFPLTAASQGGIYLLPSTGKFYVCETAYNGAQISAPNSNFVELSVWKNHDRLANLDKNLEIFSIDKITLNSEIRIPKNTKLLVAGIVDNIFVSNVTMYNDNISAVKTISLISLNTSKDIIITHKNDDIFTIQNSHGQWANIKIYKIH